MVDRAVIAELLSRPGPNPVGADLLEAERLRPTPAPSQPRPEQSRPEPADTPGQIADRRAALAREASYRRAPALSRRAAQLPSRRGGRVPRPAALRTEPTDQERS